MKFTSEGNVTLTDDALAQLAKPWDEGRIPGIGGKVTRGRPRLSDEPLDILSFKAPHSMAETIARAAEAYGGTRSSFLREAAMEKAERVLAAQ